MLRLHVEPRLRRQRRRKLRRRSGLLRSLHSQSRRRRKLRRRQGPPRPGRQGPRASIEPLDIAEARCWAGGYRCTSTLHPPQRSSLRLTGTRDIRRVSLSPSLAAQPPTSPRPVSPSGPGASRRRGPRCAPTGLGPPPASSQQPAPTGLGPPLALRASGHFQLPTMHFPRLRASGLL